MRQERRAAELGQALGKALKLVGVLQRQVAHLQNAAFAELSLKDLEGIMELGMAGGGSRPGGCSSEGAA